MPPQFICQGTADQICDVHIEGETCITYIMVIEGQAAVHVDLKATMPPQFICQGTADQICDVHAEGKTYSDIYHGDRGSSGRVRGP